MRLFAVFGNPVAHSLSPLIHNAAFTAFDQKDAIYTRVLLDRGETLRVVFERCGLSGANITVPFKEFAFDQADEVRGIAKEIGAVNTWVVENGKIIGYNSDAPGFMEALGYTPKKVLILGAGGTARALSHALIKSGADIFVLNRSEAKLAYFLREKIACSTKSPETDFDLIVNTTPAGLKDDFLPLNETMLKSYFSNAEMAFDVIYGRETPFLALARECHLKTRDGLEMLISQAAISFRLFSPTVQDGEISSVMRTALRLPKEIIWS
ncbi:MAG: shikimate dehydrogenase [Helicobacteraceae bacterium]|jgi:shikimate dehydrogenase|nr:shikimate dehydrogenase [Helicobacteraceae bacterium]